MSALFVSLLFLLVCLTLPPAAGGAKPKVGLRQDYRTLGVSPNSQTKEIKSAYRKLSVQYHPDKNRGSGAAEAEERFREITEGEDRLLNPP